MQVSTKDYLTHNYPSFCGLPNIIQLSLSNILKKIVHEDEINIFLQEHKYKDAFGFAEAALDYLNIDITIHKNQLEYIPSYGRVVIIANHPLGTLDALALLLIIKDIRKDIKIIATSLLASVENINELVIPVDNIQGKINKRSLQQIYEALAEEKIIIIFPSGEVSRVHVNGIKDTKWRNGFLKIASKMQAPILPIYINAKNSRMFYTLSGINKALATLALPHEIFKFYGKNIEFKIGQSIPFENYNLPSIPIKNRIKLFKKHLYHV